MAQIDDLIATYLNAVETEGKSVRTIKSYRDSLASFRLVGRRLGFPDAVEDHDVTHVYAFLAEVRARRGRSGRATTTPIYQNHHHRTLGAFFSWCRRMGYLDAERTHVFARVPLARIERKAPRPFSEEEIERLLAGCDRSRMTGCRNYALLLFLLAASNLRAHSESEVGAPVVTGGPHAAAISESSERQRAAKSRRCSARGIESPRPRRQRKYCRNSSNAEQKRAADAKLPKPRIG